MATIGKKNYTSFQNVNLKGTGPGVPKVPTVRFDVGAKSQDKDTTMALTLRGGSQEFPYVDIGNAGLRIGTGFIEFGHLGSATLGGTIAISTIADALYAWKLPAMSGAIPVCGTFTVQMPAIGAGAFSETSVAVTGLRADAAFVCTLQDTFNTVTTDRGFAALVGAAPANGYTHLTFFNFGTTATIPNSLSCAYSMQR